MPSQLAARRDALPGALHEGLRERGPLVRRDVDALGGSLDQLGHLLVVILANNMTARQALRLGDITPRLKQAICCDLFRSFVTNHPPPTLHLHPSSTVSSPSASSRISYHRVVRAVRPQTTCADCAGMFGRVGGSVLDIDPRWGGI